MSPRITDKKRMYELLAEGRLGNTIPQYSSFMDWLESREWNRYQNWGVRTKTPGGPCRLNVPAGMVMDWVNGFERAGHRINISVMISDVGNVTLLGEVWDSPTGLIFSGREYPEKVHDWRVEMRSPRLWEGVACRHLLRKHLNPNSLDDLLELLEKYPGHVIEFSCLDVCYGILPGRNAIVWEVRDY